MLGLRLLLNGARLCVGLRPQGGVIYLARWYGVLATTDHPGMFHSISGAIALSGATVVDARINTMTNGMALDTFSIQDAEGRAVDDLKNLGEMLHEQANGREGGLLQAAARTARGR